MNGIHDLGGMHGFGPVDVRDDESVFPERWHSRVFGMVLLTTGLGVYPPDAFRFSIESLPPDRYLRVGYYGRWLASLESRLLAAGATTAAEIEARCASLAARTDAEPAAAYSAPPVPGDLAAKRPIDAPPLFHVGEDAVVRNLHPAGHTRLPGYIRGKRGVITAHQGAWVFPDTNAHGAGEDPQHVYCLRFEARELWGPDAGERDTVHVDVFEPHLEGV